MNYVRATQSLVGHVYLVRNLERGANAVSSSGVVPGEFFQDRSSPLVGPGGRWGTGLSDASGDTEPLFGPLTAAHLDFRMASPWQPSARWREWVSGEFQGHFCNLTPIFTGLLGPSTVLRKGSLEAPEAAQNYSSKEVVPGPHFLHV